MNSSDSRYKITRRLSALVATAIALVGVSACGGGSSGETVAQVAGVGSRSKGTVEHWIPIQARLAHTVVPRRPIPRGVVPDPPEYTYCVAYLKTTRQKIVETGPKPTPAQLKRKCAESYNAVKTSVLNLLIGSDWTFGNAVASGMKVTPAEIKQRFELVKKNDLRMSDREYLKYLKYTGQTLSDMMLRSKVQLIEARLQARVIAVAKRLPKGLTEQQSQQALMKVTADLPTTKQWVARTSCHPGYVTSSCKQYKGTLPPGFPD
jgi:foldase protein PrsA